jgi:1,4-dihydroxy-2-naphthoate octaprenyltransferase
MSPWIEAMRLRTLPVSVAGVLTACAFAMAHGRFSPLWAAVCLLFALLAQVASNFANEYFDFKAGIDSPGRIGPRRGVTEGDITPRAMLCATAITLLAACLLGLSTIARGGWWLLPLGIAIALGVMAYSAGPYPLSRHCLGEAAVMLFFGIIPVNFTYYLQALQFSPDVFWASIAIGLMGSQVILVNNTRDIADDRAVGKHTLSSALLGRRGSIILYAAMGLGAALVALLSAPAIWSFAPAIGLIATAANAIWLWRHEPSPLYNRILARTSIAMFLTALIVLCLAMLG